MKTENAVCAIIAGVGAGMVLGMAVAPRSGKRSQALLKEKLASTGKEISRGLTGAVDVGKRAYDRAASSA
jgi:hypothetical protein